MASDVVWSGAADVLLMLSNLFSLKLLGDGLTPTGWGAYLGFFAIVGPLGSLSWAGLNLVVLQRILREGEDPTRVSKVSFTLLIMQGIIAVGLAMAIAYFVIDEIPRTALLIIGLVELIVAPLVMLSAALRQALLGFPSAARLKMVLVATRTTVLITLWATGALTLVNLGLGWLFSVGVLALYCMTRLLPRIGATPGFALPTRAQAGNVASLSLPMASGNLQTDGDKAVLNYFGMAYDAGIYGVAFRVVMLAQLPIQTMNTALFQRFLTHTEGVRRQHLNRTIRFTAVSATLSVMIAVVMYFAAPIITLLLSEYDESVEIVRWLLLYLPIVAISHAPLNGLLGLGATRLRAVILLGSAAVAMALYIALIPPYAWRGALIGTIIAELTLLTVGWIALIICQGQADRRTDAAAAAKAATLTPAYID